LFSYLTLGVRADFLGYDGKRLQGTYDIALSLLKPLYRLCESGFAAVGAHCVSDVIRAVTSICWLIRACACAAASLVQPRRRRYLSCIRARGRREARAALEENARGYGVGCVHALPRSHCLAGAALTAR
jgi:hypothetical protein